MAYTPVADGNARDSLDRAEARWRAVLEARPDLGPAVGLQRRLLAIVADVAQTLDREPLPSLSRPAGYLAAKLSRGLPVLAGEPVPLPVPLLAPALLTFCDALADAGAAEPAAHIKDVLEEGEMAPASLLLASLTRNQTAIRTGAVHRGLAPDLVWLVAELAVSPFVHLLQRALLAGCPDEALSAALQAWNCGYCPACGSWPAVAEAVGGHRTLRCSFCASAWEPASYACIYCGEAGEHFVTAAPDEQRKDRRVEVCGACGAYLKTIDLQELSPFPLLAITDLETTDLDVAAMEHGYVRPMLKDFSRFGP